MDISNKLLVDATYNELKERLQYYKDEAISSYTVELGKSGVNLFKKGGVYIIEKECGNCGKLFKEIVYPETKNQNGDIKVSIKFVNECFDCREIPY